MISIGLRSVPLNLFAAHCAPVLTYHACFRAVPPNVAAADNITPELLYAHLEVLKKRYRVLAIDELIESRSLRGVAAVTFDDGYKSVIEHALPVLESLGVPATIFVNIAPLERKIFWRHKVLYIQQHGLTAECEAALHKIRRVHGQDFYTYLKHPSNNSQTAEAELDAFLQAKNITPDQCGYLFDSPSYFARHPLIWYGNHTHNHYVMSSLSYAEQLEEISTVADYLKSQPGIQVSRIFSLPFGEAHHVNQATFLALKELGYKSLAMNRGLLNTGRVYECGIRVLERFSPAGQPLELQIKKRFGATLVARRGSSLRLPTVMSKSRNDN